MQRGAPWWAGTVLALAVVVFAWFVWPTPWMSHDGPVIGHHGPIPMRRHLVTGERQMKMLGEWVPLEVVTWSHGLSDSGP